MNKEFVEGFVKEAKIFKNLVQAMSTANTKVPTKIVSGNEFVNKIKGLTSQSTNKAIARTHSERGGFLKPAVPVKVKDFKRSSEFTTPAKNSF